MTNNSSQTIEEVILRVRAGYPIIWVKTEEYARAIEILQSYFREDNKDRAQERAKRGLEVKEPQTAEKKAEKKEIPNGLRHRNLFHWDAINGLVNVTDLTSPCERVFPPAPEKKDQLVAEPPAFTHILAWGNHLKKETVPVGSIVIVDGFHNLLAACCPLEVGKMRAAIMQIIKPTLRKVNGEARAGLRESNSYRTVIIVGPKPDHPVLSPDIMTYLEVIELPRPSEEEISSMIEIQLGKKKTTDDKLITENKDLVALCGRELKGTTVFQSENAISLTYIKKRALDQETLRRQYKAIMELHPALTLAEYSETWDDLIGFELYKKFITALFHPDQKDPSIKGALLVGVPGGGKSMAAKATGNRLGIKTIFCNFGRLFNKYIGNSEGNAESLFRSVDACGRAIIFVDEIEKALGGMGKGGGGDSGVGDRVFGQTLTWMNDHTSGAFLIATANDPHILPSELLRVGRWNCIFNVPPPNLLQRKAMLELYGGRALLSFDSKEIAERTDLWVGSEIKGLMDTAKTFRMISKNDTDALQTAFSYIKPMCVSDTERFTKRMEESKAQGVSVNIEDDLAADLHIGDEPLEPRQRSLED